MTLEDKDPVQKLMIVKEHVEHLTGLLKRVNTLSKVTLELADKINNRNLFLRSLIRKAYDEGRKHPHDETGSSFDRWMAAKETK